MQTPCVHALRQLIVEDKLGGGSGEQAVARGLGGVAQHGADRQEDAQAGGALETVSQDRQAAEGEAGDEEGGLGEEGFVGGGLQPRGEGARRSPVNPGILTPPP